MLALLSSMLPVRMEDRIRFSLTHISCSALSGMASSLRSKKDRAEAGRGLNNGEASQESCSFTFHRKDMDFLRFAGSK